MSTMRLSVSPNSPVHATYEQGIAVLKSQKKHGVVLRLLNECFTDKENGRPTIYVAVGNGGEVPFDFSTGNITAFSGSDLVRVFTFEDLAKEITRKAKMMAFAMALNGASQSMSASMPQRTYTTGSAYVTGNSGTARINYSGVSTTYNPAAVTNAQSQINANTMSQMSGIAASRDAQLNNLGAILRRNTVSPGAIAGGIVCLDGDDIKVGKILKIQVIANDEVHEFFFEVKKQ